MLHNLPDARSAEITEIIHQSAAVRIERIVSHGQSSPDGFWYDQSDAEWVMVLAGAARLQIEGEGSPRLLGPGDALNLPAHCRHRVLWTDPKQPTVWLAVFVKEATDGL
ncbi:MAG: cupin domain-containing protein [Pseudomonadota bacterium]